MQKANNKKLYKYRAFSARALDMFANNELYLAPTAKFNDPFDCYNVRDFVFPDTDEKISMLLKFETENLGSSEKATHLIERIKESEEAKKEYLNLRKKHFIELVLQTVGVCSFSEINYDILMWSHYSDGHKGFCLEFERDTYNHIQLAAGKVQYPPTYEFPVLDDTFWYRSQEKALDAAVKIIETKSPHWDYEKEWRMIDHKFGTQKYNGHIVKYPISMIAGIIYGYKLSDNNRRTIRKIFRNKNISVYEAKPVKNKFKVEIVPAKE